MPIQIASFLMPKSGVDTFLLEDKYVKGGFQSFASDVERDSVSSIVRKSGMLAHTAHDGKFWKLNPDLTTWSEVLQQGPAGIVTAQDVATVLGYVPANKAGDTFTGIIDATAGIKRTTASGTARWMQQDGTGRQHWYWNTTGGTVPVFEVGGEDALDVMHSANGGAPFFKVRMAIGTGKLAGDPITWTDILAASFATFTYNGQTVYHSGNLLSVSQLTNDSGFATITELSASASAVQAACAPASHVGSSGSSHAVVTTSVNGFMSAADKIKLDGIQAGAIDYVHPTGDGNLHVPATGTTNNGKVLTAGATAGSLSWSTVGTVTSVTATAPVVSSGGAAPVISMPAASSTVNGYLSSANWTTFNNKQNALGFTPVNRAGDVVQGSIGATAGWSGTSTAAGKLSGVPIAFVCQRSGIGSVGDKLAFGNGSTTNGIAMPFAGKLVAAVLSGTNITGTITLNLLVSGVANSSYQLTATGSASNVTNIKDFQATPLAFSAGTMLNWTTVSAPTVATGYEVTFFVILD